ncbi:MAG: dTDP-4-dehydrorhamnose 3,5-epimerase [Pseudomonadota bacterium]
MIFSPCTIPDIILIEPRVFGDDRGFFMETWRKDDFKKHVTQLSFVQENHSRSRQGVLRGLHYQIVKPQGKLIRIVAGEVFDVAVDLRRSSPTFKQWTGITLSADNKKSLWIPPGFAHGFLVISKEAELIYKCTDYYAPEHERCINWNDPAIGINWPVCLAGIHPILSDKDAAGRPLETAEVYEQEIDIPFP